MVQVEPLGILLGVAFVAAIGTLLIWMFRVPRVTTLPAVKAFRSMSAVHKILIPITDAFPSERAIGLGCRLGQEQKAELVLLNVIIVPLSMSLDTPLPEMESRADRTLELGAVIAHRYDYEVRKRKIRHRNIPDGILQVAREEEADAIVMGVGIKTRAAIPWGRTSLEILRRATCEVIVDKVPLEEEITPQ